MGLFSLTGTPDRNESKPTKPPRPNFSRIHAQPLPLKTYPVPLVTPHNPLSVLHVAFSYLWQFLTAPSSHPQPFYQGYFSPETLSVHITDENVMRALWEQGFFGKGSLSRSEPAWLQREKIRQGLLTGETSEQYTEKRREERKAFKKERARKEREAIESRLAEEEKVGASGAVIGAQNLESTINIMRGVDNLTSEVQDLELQDDVDIETLVPIAENGASPSAIPEQLSETSIKEIANQEHLQLSPEEAFFLSYALGVLQICSPTSSLIPTTQLLSLFRSHSYFPPIPAQELQPDDPFLLSYVTYHHFRSLGWVVRPGIKFGVDFLLYNRGPVFSHAEFAVVVMPSYTHAYWISTDEGLARHAKRKESRSWWWVHCANRVQTQVRKTLVVAFVEVPPPPPPPTSPRLSDLEEHEADIGKMLRRYKIREMILKRWTPNRGRD
ncbi:MAG: hypothetical protein Q9190_003063 [Brigantiaea leucoxantha]